MDKFLQINCPKYVPQLGFTPFKAEQSLRGMRFQEREPQNNKV